MQDTDNMNRGFIDPVENNMASHLEALEIGRQTCLSHIGILLELSKGNIQNALVFLKLRHPPVFDGMGQYVINVALGMRSKYQMIFRA